MARDIDFENLDDDDIQYLRQRSSLVQEAELLGYEGVRKQVEEWQPEAEAEAEAETETETPAAETGEEETPPYSEWSKDELVAELKERGLSASGNKDELVARLDANDEEDEEEEE